MFHMRILLIFKYLTDDNSGTVFIDAIFMVAYIVYMLGNSFIYCYVAEKLRAAVRIFKDYEKIMF